MFISAIASENFLVERKWESTFAYQKPSMSGSYAATWTLIQESIPTRAYEKTHFLKH